MIILDPDMNGCTVWCVDSYFPENFVTNVKGTASEVVNQIIPYITEEVEIRNQWGHKWRSLELKDEVFIDNCILSKAYIDIFSTLGYCIQIIPSRHPSVHFRKE